MDDVNQLMTEMNAAVADEDYGKAAAVKKRLDELAVIPKGDWVKNGVPTWLGSRLGNLGMRFPTPIQARCLQEGGLLDETSDVDVMIRAPTGSGKTLAYAVPMLGALTEQLEERDSAEIKFKFRYSAT